jgi:hypothetical protein
MIGTMIPLRHYRTHVVLPLCLPLALIGCATPSKTFEPGKVRVTRASWDFQGRPGARLTTEHFDIFTTGHDAELIEHLPQFLETTYLFYSSLLPAASETGDGDERMQTYFFGRRSEWGAFVKTRFPERYPLYRKIPMGAFTEGTTCVAYNIGRDRTWALLAHEGFHQYVHARFGDVLPAWLSEGLATYCESVEFRDGRPHFTPQRNAFRIRHLRQAYAAGTASSVRQLLDEEAGRLIESIESSAANAYYAQAWALTVYLLRDSGPQYADMLPEIARDLQDNTLRVNAQATRAAAPNPAETTFGQAVFRQYVTDDLDRFESDFNDYVHKLCWK